MERGRSLATRGPRRALPVAALVLVLLAASPAAFVAGAAHATATFELPPGPHLAGEPLVVRVRVLDASSAPMAAQRVELAPYGEHGVTNDEGVALFRIVDDEPSVRELRALVDGEPLGSAAVTWRRASLAIDAPAEGLVGRSVLVEAAARWLPDGAPIAEADLGVFRDGALIEAARTGADGDAVFHLVSGRTEQATYEIAFDDPSLRAAVASLTVAWNLDLAPVVESVAIVFAGRTAQAVVGNVSDPEGDAVQLSYRWEVNGADRGFDQPLIEVARGARVRVAVYADDGARDPATIAPRWSPFADAPANTGPELTILRTGPLTLGAQQTFDARASVDAEGGIEVATWRFSDGANASGLLARHAFASPGAHWAELRATDDEGATSRARIDFEVTDPDAPGPSPPPSPRFTFDAEGRTFTLDAYAATDVTLVRALVLDGSAHALLATPDGLRLWEPVPGRLSAVASSAAARVTTEHAPGEVRSDYALTAAGLRTARIPDPQPGLDLLDVTGDGLFAHWRDASDVVVLTDASRATLRHEVARLAVRLDIEPRDAGVYLVRATATGGAPIEQLRIMANGVVVGGGREASIEALLTPAVEMRIEAVATDVGGDEASAAQRITPAPVRAPEPPEEAPPIVPTLVSPTATTPPTPTRAVATTVAAPTPPAVTVQAPAAPDASNGTVTAAARDEAPGLGLAALVVAWIAVAVASRRRRP